MTQKVGQDQQVVKKILSTYLAQYLISVQHDFVGDWKSLGKDLLEAMQMRLIQRSEYLTAILLDLYARLPFLDQAESLIDMYPKSSPMVRRKIVRAATALGMDYWLREQKETLPSVNPWLRRALIASACAFSKDEREYWLRRIEKEGTPLERIVAKWARTHG